MEQVGELIGTNLLIQAHLQAETFIVEDFISLKRGCIWNEGFNFKNFIFDGNKSTFNYIQFQFEFTESCAELFKGGHVFLEGFGMGKIIVDIGGGKRYCFKLL